MLPEPALSPVVESRVLPGINAEEAPANRWRGVSFSILASAFLLDEMLLNVAYHRRPPEPGEASSGRHDNPRLRIHACQGTKSRWDNQRGFREPSELAFCKRSIFCENLSTTAQGQVHWQRIRSLMVMPICAAARSGCSANLPFFPKILSPNSLEKTVPVVQNPVPITKCEMHPDSRGK